MAYNRNQKHRNHSSTNQRDERPYKPFRKKLGRHEFIIEGCPTGVKVPDPSIGTLERALKYLKRQAKDMDLIGKYRKNQEYIKPSLKRSRLRLEAIRALKYKTKMDARREKDYVWTAIVDGKAR